MTTTRVQSIWDDSPCPFTGRIVGREDDDRVLVVWDGCTEDEARVEWADELTPTRSAR